MIPPAVASVPHRDGDPR